MNPVQFILAFIDTFNSKKLLVLLFLVFLVGSCLGIFEYYTSHFNLSRIQHSAEILNKVVSIREGHTLTTEEEVQRSLLLESLAPSKSSWAVGVPSFKFAFRWDKFLLGGIPWFLIGLAMTLTQKQHKIGENIAVTLFGSSIFGLLSLLSPFDSIFMMIFVTPFTIMTIVVSLFVVAAKVSASKETK